MKFATRITNSSPTSFGMYEKCRSLSSDSSDFIHLEVGQPDADTPSLIKEATISALLAGDVHYSDFRGSLSLRQAICEKLERQNNLSVSADEVLVTNGLTHGAFAAFLALLNEGDEVILLSPHYPQHIGKVELAGARPVFVALDADSGFRIDGNRIAAHITPRTRMIVLVNPCNPTGRVYDLSELESLAAVAIEHDLVVVSDEVYEDIVFSESTHISIASLPGMKERTVSLFAFTKSYAMDGWRIGYTVAPPEAISALLKVTKNDVAHVNTFIQTGALTAITRSHEILPLRKAEDEIRRDFVVQSLNAMKGVTCASPEGTIYAFADVRGTGFPSQLLADRLMREARVGVEAGSFYGRAGEGFIRICFGSQPLSKLQIAMTRMRDFFLKLH